LPGWLFTKEAATVDYLDRNGDWRKLALPACSYAFNFLGQILTVYHNPQRRDSFGKRACRIKEIHLTYPQKEPVIIPGALVPPEHARRIRHREVERMDIYFG